MNFFDANNTGEVLLMNFINGMTLLYGDLSLLADAARRDLQLASDRSPLVLHQSLAMRSHEIHPFSFSTA